jgi:prevent-host-death family protein
MTKTVNVAEAKARLSQILDEAAAGKDIVIARRGVPVARLVPVSPRKGPRRLGTARGLMEMAPDFDDPLPDFDEYR